MARYIDAEKFEDEMYHESFEKDSDMQKWDSGCWIRYKLFADCLEKQPTADVVEVVHGEWITVTLSRGRKTILCSNCRGHLETFGLTDYCPRCGAKMDGTKVK